VSVYRDWTVRDLARAAKVSPEQIEEWIEADQLKASVDSLGIVRLPLTEAVAAYALRDGKDPQEARDDLMRGREKSFVHDPLSKPKEELEANLESFLVQNRLPEPERVGVAVDDPRKEPE
jgi:hypothetical protein